MFIGHDVSWPGFPIPFPLQFITVKTSFSQHTNQSSDLASKFLVWISHYFFSNFIQILKFLRALNLLTLIIS